MSVADQGETIAKLEEMRRLSERVVELADELAYGPFTALDGTHRYQIGTVWARGVPYEIDEALESLNACIPTHDHPVTEHCWRGCPAQR